MFNKDCSEALIEAKNFLIILRQMLIQKVMDYCKCCDYWCYIGHDEPHFLQA